MRGDKKHHQWQSARVAGNRGLNLLVVPLETPNYISLPKQNQNSGARETTQLVKVPTVYQA